MFPFFLNTKVHSTTHLSFDAASFIIELPFFFIFNYDLFRILRNSWQNLLKLLSQREQKLHGAGEIHRFHRDVAEALFRIQDKNAALSSELGKDLNSALALLRKHEGFENDLVALEAQLQVCGNFFAFPK